jgi:hypothetical protein
MTKLFFLLSAAWILIVSPLAYSGQTILGGGTMLCETYAQSDEVIKLANENWVLGFLSSANMRAKNQDLLLDVDTVVVIAAVESFCAAHASDKISDAAIHVLMELVATSEGDCTSPHQHPARARGLNHCDNPASFDQSKPEQGLSMTVPAVE